jgi:hypothetical protein
MKEGNEMNAEDENRLKMWLRFMEQGHDAHNALIVEEMAAEGIPFVYPNEETAPSLGRVVGKKIVGPSGTSLHLEVNEDVVRNTPAFMEMMAHDAIESIKRTIWRDDLYRANGLKP